jgi:hypothetical protein
MLEICDIWCVSGSTDRSLQIWIQLRISLLSSALFKSAQHLYEKREGSGARSEPVPLINGSGSGRPKNMRILRNLLIRIRIPNTGLERPLRDHIGIFYYNFHVTTIFVCLNTRCILLLLIQKKFCLFLHL